MDKEQIISEQFSLIAELEARLGLANNRADYWEKEYRSEHTQLSQVTAELDAAIADTENYMLYVGDCQYCKHYLTGHCDLVSGEECKPVYRGLEGEI